MPTKQTDPIKAVEVDLTGDPQANTRASANPQFRPTSQVKFSLTRKTLQSIALAFCLLLALAVIFVLPKLVEEDKKTNAAINHLKADQQDRENAESETTQQKQKNLQARREAQDVLSRIQEKKLRLENKNVSTWAGNIYTEAMEGLEKGDFDYRQQRYSQALSAYLRTESILDQLKGQVESRLQQALNDGLQALEQGKTERATTQFQLALSLENEQTETLSQTPDQQNLEASPAQQGLVRAEQLPALMKLVSRGEQQLKENSLEDALQSFKAAAALDNQHSLPRSGLQRAQQAIDKKRYDQAMSEGFKHVAGENYRSAISAFQRAIDIAPESNAARSALSEARNRQKLETIEYWLAQAQLNETQENWPDALDYYQKALELDDTITASHLGQIRSRVRAELDQQIESLLANPLRLASDSVYRRGENLLKDARGIAEPGPRLQEQIEKLQGVLTAARTPILLVLQSDNATQVSVQKIGELGHFTRKELQLTPGRYVAKGYRPGYRDVRVEFNISNSPSEKPLVVQVQCVETI